jgi:hypothetical protein
MVAGMFLYQLVDKTWLQPSASAPQREPRVVTATTPAFQGPQDA